MEHEIIDEISDSKDHSVLTDALSWWEKRRLLFNVIMGIVGLTTILYFGDFQIDLFVIIGSVLWGFVANAFYTIGFLFEAFSFHYLKSNAGLKTLRWPFFVIGTCAYSVISFSFGMSIMINYPLFI